MSVILKILLGTLVVAGGLSYYLLRRLKPQLYKEYRDNCIKVASGHLQKNINRQKAILVFKTHSSSTIVPVLYMKYNDGKIMKTEMEDMSFPIRLCPNDIQEELLTKSEYIIYKF